MQPWEPLDVARAPDGTELQLWRRGTELVVRVHGEELMSNRRHGSEEQLAELACADLEPKARVLIGGLGLGFTLKATLATLPARSVVIVRELVPKLASWVRAHAGGAAMLEDRRVRIEFGDVAARIESSEGAFDAIVLDVDNGPTALVKPSNARLYGVDGLAAAKRALVEGGRLAIGSASHDAAFLRRFEQAGFEARAVEPRTRRGNGGRHVVFIGTRRRER